MRRSIAVVAVAGVACVGVQVPAWAAVPTAPTDVQVGWSDAAAGLVRTSWTDTGEANKLRIEYKDGTPTADWATRKASLPNEVIGGQPLFNKIARIRVVSVDAAGAESTAAVSPWFDTNLLGQPTVTAATALPGGALRLAWKRTAVTDSTPNDPLDLAPGPETVNLKVGMPHYDMPEAVFPQPAGASTGVVPARALPYPAFVQLRNEWGTVWSRYVMASDMKLFLRKVPAYGQYGRPLVIEGQAGQDSCLDRDYCRLWQGAGVPVTMQARPSKTKPWQYAGHYTAYADTIYDNVGFETAGGAVGGREYRFYVPAWTYRYKDEWDVSAAVSTTARYIPTQSYFRVVGFNTFTAKVGQAVKATVDVQPAGTVKADLQWSDGKTWHHGAYIPLTKGKGTLTLKAAGRGTTRSWRVVVPKMTMNGLPIVTTPSRTFKLTVR
ncbi:hypothetical protein [Kribbella ginsengisoli]|uniref:hypothetical protein n=1 Tax=Kribbella ginsengisoli TaxID=363865 RepID=UPI0031D34C32